MNILNNIKQRFLGSFSPKQEIELSAVDTTRTSARNLYSRLKLHSGYRTALEIDQLESAILQAENLSNPNRLKLYSLYREVSRDAHLSAQVRVALNMLQSTSFKLTDSNAQEIFEKAWFKDFIKHSLDTELWGHSLIQVLKHKGEFRLQLLPREHIEPLTKQIRTTVTDKTGIAYQDKLQVLSLVELGSAELGSLSILARQVIYKQYARSDWSEYSEKFGMPLLAIKTQESNPTELDKMEEMAQQFGSNGYVFLGKEDDVQIIAPGKSDGFQVYKENIAYSDEQISKVINGQTSTSDQKAFVGSAEVHERVLNQFTKARLDLIQNEVNSQLIPLLAKLGFVAEKTHFEFITESKPTPTVGKPKTKTKAPESSLHHTVQNLYSAEQYHNVTLTINNDEFEKVYARLKIDDVVNEAIKQIHHLRELADDYIEPNMYQSHYAPLLDAIDQGITGIGYKVDPAMIHALKENASVFSAFKTHHQQKEMVAELVDAEGNRRTFSQFHKAVKPIVKKYNREWLKTEYITANKRARVAAQFNQFQQTAHIYPNIEWLASTSINPRELHKPFYGMVRPINDPIWQLHFPGNLWNCKCRLRRSSKDITDKPKGPLPKAHKGLDGNLLKGELIGGSHPYFERVHRDLSEKLRAKAAKIYTKSVVQVTKDWAKKTIPLEGVVYKSKNLASGQVTLHRGGVKDIIGKTVHNEVKAYPKWLKDDVKNWDYIGYSVSKEQARHPDADYFTFYKTKFGKTTRYINVKVSKVFGETVYCVYDKIDMKRVIFGYPPKIKGSN